MKKNAHYVGVDEKYIPEDEKYVDDTVADDIKKDIKEGYNNLDKGKVKKGAKFLAKASMFYFAFVMIFIIVVFIIVVSMFIRFPNFCGNSNGIPLGHKYAISSCVVCNKF